MFRIWKLSLLINPSSCDIETLQLRYSDVEMPVALRLSQKVLSSNRTRGQSDRREGNRTISSKTTFMRVKVKGAKSKQKIKRRWAWFLTFSRLIEFYFSADIMFSFRFPFPFHSILTAHLLVYTLNSLCLYSCHQSLPVPTYSSF